MKRLFVSALVVCALSMWNVVSAQEVEKKECPVKEGKECVSPRKDMAKELNLTPEQQERMKAAHEEYARTAKQSREDMNAAGEKHRAAMEEILTPEQKEKMKEMRKEMKGKKEMRHHRGHRGHKHGAKCDSVKCDKPCKDVRECDKKGSCDKANGDCKKGDKSCDKKRKACCHGEKR